MSAIPQAITFNPHTNLLNVYIQIANKMEFEPNKNKNNFFFQTKDNKIDGLCGLMIRVPGYRSRGSGFDSRSHQVSEK
jgi:hypothetical protein